MKHLDLKFHWLSKEEIIDMIADCLTKQSNKPKYDDNSIIGHGLVISG